MNIAEIHLNALAITKPMRTDFAEANAEFVREHYDIFKVNEARFAIYSKLID